MEELMETKGILNREDESGNGIRAALDAQDKMLAVLVELLASLEVKIEPILRDQAITKGVGGDPPTDKEARYRVVDHIQSHNRIIDLIMGRIDNMSSRVNL